MKPEDLKFLLLNDKPLIIVEDGKKTASDRIKPGRRKTKSDAERRKKTVKSRVTPSEYERIEELSGGDISGYIRRTALGDRRYELPQIHRDTYAELAAINVTTQDIMDTIADAIEGDNVDTKLESYLLGIFDETRKLNDPARAMQRTIANLIPRNDYGEDEAENPDDALADGATLEAILENDDEYDFS
jgi:hypothetical protein